MRSTLDRKHVVHGAVLTPEGAQHFERLERKLDHEIKVRQEIAASQRDALARANAAEARAAEAEREREEVTAENERLREALQKIGAMSMRRAQQAVFDAALAEVSAPASKHPQDESDG